MTLQRDAKLLITTRLLRSFSLGLLGFSLSLYYNELNFDYLKIGILLGFTLLGSGLSTIIAGLLSQRYRLKKIILGIILISSLSFLIFILTDNFILLLITSLFAFINPNAKDAGPLMSLEQAFIPFISNKEDRTFLYSLWNISASVSLSFGLLMAGVPFYLGYDLIYSPLLIYKFIFSISLILNLSTLFVYRSLSDIEISHRKSKNITIKNKKTIYQLSLLFALDAFGGGFIISNVISLWFKLNFHASNEQLSLIFSIGGILEAISYIFANPIANRFGLLNTMVFTHIPANIMLMLVPFIPTFLFASIIFVSRSILSQMDVPTRQAFIVLLVDEDERTILTSITNVSRLGASSTAPLIATQLLQGAIFSTLFIGGGIKILYDLLIYQKFKSVELEGQ